MKKLIYDSYCEAVALAQVPEELKRALRVHERTPKFLENLEIEFKKLPNKFTDAITIKNAVYDLTNLYVNNLHRMANERMMSESEKIARLKRGERLKKFDADADKINETGIITEDMLED